jgi:hypothetical protein
MINSKRTLILQLRGLRVGERVQLNDGSTIQAVAVNGQRHYTVLRAGHKLPGRADTRRSASEIANYVMGARAS